MSKKPTIALALAAGYTRAIHAFSSHYDLELLVQPAEDLDERFRAFDLSSNAWLWINGWMFVTEDVIDEPTSGVPWIGAGEAIANGLTIVAGVDAELRAFA